MLIGVHSALTCPKLGLQVIASEDEVRSLFKRPSKRPSRACGQWGTVGRRKELAHMKYVCVCGCGGGGGVMPSHVLFPFLLQTQPPLVSYPKDLSGLLEFWRVPTPMGSQRTSTNYWRPYVDSHTRARPPCFAFTKNRSTRPDFSSQCESRYCVYCFPWFFGGRLLG